MEFANYYMENILNEVSDLTKQRIMLKSQVAWLESAGKEKDKHILELTSRIQELEEKVKTLSSKKAKKEEQTDSSTF